jgi:O-antigen ligase
VNILLFAVVLLSAFVGFQVVINGAGTIVKGRLEGLNFPGASGSNGVAAVLTMSFPLIGYFVIANPIHYSRISAFLCAPLILDTVLRCNSRGAYLGAAVGGICLVLMARGQARKYAVGILVIGVLAFCLQARNSNIWERLFSVTASAEDRDNAAQERIQSWIAGVKMISDYPLGSGGRAAFVSPRGAAYIQHIRTDGFRSIHNGYLNILAGWGVQGFALLMMSFAVAGLALWRAIRHQASIGNDEQTFLGSAIFAALASMAVITTFGDYLDGEWFIWLAVIGLSYAQLAEDSLADEQDDEATEEAIDEDTFMDEGHETPSPTVQFP